MPIVTFIILLLVIVALAFFFMKSMKITAIKLMLLGIHITILGGILIIDSYTDIGGFEYLILFFGLFLSVIGFLKSDGE